MSLVLNMVSGGGGGLSSTDALLLVQAPAGCTVTITKGSTTKTDQGHENADDSTIYDYYFIIHQSQFDSITPWNVTATLGEKTASDTIIINSNKQYDLFIQMILYLYDNGDENIAVTGGWEAKKRYGSYLGTLTKNASNMVLTGNDPLGNSAFAGIVNDISNLQSNYSTAYIETGSITSRDNGLVFLDNWTTQTIISSVALSANSIHSLPIPSGSSVIAVYSNNGSVTIKKVWME